MATNTYVAIEIKTITSTVQAVTFTSIPQTYTDLVLVAQPKCDVQRDLEIRVGNGSLDTGSNYSTTAGWASTTTTGSNRNSGATYMYGNYYAGATATAGENVRIYHFNNYANTNTFKSVLMRSSTASKGVDMLVGTWRSTSAINTISIFPLSGDIVAGSIFTLYGIENAEIGAPKAFGGTITQDAIYTYHTFGASGTFTPQQSLTADILVVAGGGGSAYGSGGGGGGAGGLLTHTSQSLTATGYTVTVGAGGTTPSSGAVGGSGNNSQFGALTASVGGGGGGFRGTNGLSGGSGGGAGSINTTQTGGSGTAGQGNAGGNSISNGFCVAGGGGAGAVGASATSTKAGDGGIGVTSALLSAMGAATGTGQSSGNDYYYAGGGGGGSSSSPSGATLIGGVGGLGGGGRGGFVTGETGTAGLALTGGGGGSGHTSAIDTAGGRGGSGVVIIRYATA
jgi:hypothetical protein